MEHCGTGCPTCSRLRRAAVLAAFEDGLPGLTIAAVAERARVPGRVLGSHRSGTLHGCVAEAYGLSTLALQRDFALRFTRGPTWVGGLVIATRGLLDTVVARPELASFCYVEILRGDRSLLELREMTRRRSVRLFVSEYAARRGGERVPRLQVEFVCGAIIHAIASAAETRTDPDVRSTLAAVAHLAEACEPLPRPDLL
jgi:hypothetical protein